MKKAPAPKPLSKGKQSDSSKGKQSDSMDKIMRDSFRDNRKLLFLLAAR